MDRFGFVIKCVAVTSSALLLLKTKPFCSKKPSPHGMLQTPHNPYAENTEHSQNMCVVKDLMKANYGRPFFVCSNKSKPCSFWAWGDVKPLAKPNCRHNIPCAIRKVKKEGINKDRLFFNCPKNKEDSCNYFEWVPEQESHDSYHCTNSVEPIPIKTKKTKKSYLSDDFINGFCSSLNF